MIRISDYSMTRINVSLAFGSLAVFLIAATTDSTDRSGDVAVLVNRIKAVRAEGDGNLDAKEASRKLATYGPDAILPVLAAMDDADAVSANWLRAAVDSISERTIASQKKLPAAQLEQFVLDTKHAGRVRRLAFEWLAKIDTTAPDRLVPGMLNDPGPELRRDAVDRAITNAQKLLESNDKPGAHTAFRKAFDAARDRDQVLDIAKRLESFGDTMDLTRHFGCVQRWHIIGPFDNTDKSGFDRAYPPESAIKLDAEYKGTPAANETIVRWVEHTSTDQFGVVDLNKTIGKHMGVVAYAVTYVNSDKDQPARIHVGSTNAIKVWLNGKLIYTRDEYHHGMSMDQYQATGELKSGRNTILLKVCQNEQKEEWAQNWMFQLRVCDPTGGGIQE